jgi:sugar diacid utilization regulator
VLLHPAGAGGGPDLIAFVERVIARARAVVPGLEAQAVADDEPAALDELSRHVVRLARLCSYGPRGPAAQPVSRARRYALEGLLRDSVAPAEARTFVDDLLGGLIAWDREHRSDLLRVLEAALDNPRHDVAARRCFMHRNTFRHRLNKALAILGDDLSDPDMRLAVHVALRLHRATAAATR